MPPGIAWGVISRFALLSPCTLSLRQGAANGFGSTTRAGDAHPLPRTDQVLLHPSGRNLGRWWSTDREDKLRKNTMWPSMTYNALCPKRRP